MSRFDERLEQNLRQIADRATPSPNAWTAIQTRIADQDPAEETEIIMLTETDPPARRRGPLLAAAVAVLALVVGLGLIARDDESEQSDPPAPSPTEVLELFVQAFNAHDIDAVVALYADDAVVTGHPLIENPPAEGAQEIRALTVEDLGVANTYEVRDVVTTGNSVTFAHLWYPSDGGCYAGTDRMVIENGKIAEWEMITGSRPCPQP